MRERAPPRLDQGVGELQFGERQDSAQDSRGDQVIDLGVHVLDAPRPPTRPESSLRASPPTGFDEHDHTVHGRERFSNAPRQDPSREVVDHGVEVDAGPVKQADDGGVDVPHLVSARRSKAHLRLCGVHAEAGAAPAVLPDEAVPGGGRGPDRAEPLRQDGERAGRDVPVLGCGHHVLNCPDLGRGQSMRRRVRTGRLIGKAHTRLAAVARHGTDSATSEGTAGAPALAQTLGPDPRAQDSDLDAFVGQMLVRQRASGAFRRASASRRSAVSFFTRLRSSRTSCWSSAAFRPDHVLMAFTPWRL